MMLGETEEMGEFAGLCRLCLKPSKEKMTNISHYDDLITLVAQVKIVKHTSIPHQICQTCSSILVAAGMLRVNCVEANKYFLDYLTSKGLEPLSADAIDEWETEIELAELSFKQDTELEIIDEMVVEENFSLESPVSQPALKKPKLMESDNCRLCLSSSKRLPDENAIVLMKDMLRKILDLKHFNWTHALVPDKLCDDCMGLLKIACSITDKCVAAYAYFHSKDSVIITTSTCWVCLKDFQNECDICDMSTMTYSYMHYLATRNSGKEQTELEGERRICLKCMHDLEVANSVRYKNWKSERVLDMQYGNRSNTKNAKATHTYDPWNSQDPSTPHQSTKGLTVNTV